MHLLEFYTSGKPAQLERLLPGLLGEIAPVERISWKAGMLVEG